MKPPSTCKNWWTATPTFDSAHLNLGRIAEEKGDPQGALAEYEKVGGGNDYLPAQLRQADILMASGRLAEARKRLEAAREASPITPSNCTWWKPKR